MASKKVKEKTIKETYEEFISAHPLKQTIFPKLLILVSTAYNAGMPLNVGEKELSITKIYETITFYFENKRDLEKRTYKRFVINRFYSSKQLALKGHSEIVKNIKKENPSTPYIHIKKTELKKIKEEEREEIMGKINSHKGSFMADILDGGMWTWKSEGGVDRFKII